MENLSQSLLLIELKIEIIFLTNEFEKLKMNWVNLGCFKGGF